jgi:uncharacterized protein YjiS (DUF1127 family)
LEPKPKAQRRETIAVIVSSNTDTGHIRFVEEHGLMTAKTRTVDGSIPIERPSLLDFARSTCRSYRKWRDAKRAIAHLKAMDDRMLKDIGISRGEIMCVVLTGSREK